MSMHCPEQLMTLYIPHSYAAVGAAADQSVPVTAKGHSKDTVGMPA
jgi:hypothetical protein